MLMQVCVTVERSFIKWKYKANDGEIYKFKFIYKLFTLIADITQYKRPDTPNHFWICTRGGMDLQRQITKIQTRFTSDFLSTQMNMKGLASSWQKAEVKK